MATPGSVPPPQAVPPSYVSSTAASDNTLSLSASTEKEVAIHSTNEKELVLPETNDTDKEVFSRTADSGKEAYGLPLAADADTAKQVAPSTLPEVDMGMTTEKEVAVPSNNGDKQLTSSLSHRETNGSRVSRTDAMVAFRVEKENSLGLVVPQDQKLAVHEVDARTGEVAGAGPVFVTGEMSWIDVAVVLPPMFELFRCRASGSGRGDEPGAMGMTMELVGRSVSRGWQGMTGLTVEIEADCQSQDAQGGVTREKWVVDRRGFGFGRTYKLRQEGEKDGGLVWKGTSSSVKEMIGDVEKKKKEKVHKGNLKLVSSQDGGKILAVWQQARDSSVLGDLVIFNASKGRVSPEIIVMSCLTAVCAERASGMNWIGGFGK